MKLLVSALMIIFSTISYAHVATYPKSGDVGKYALVTFNVPHGCYGEPTSELTIISPIVGLNMHPQLKYGWQIVVESKDLPETMKPHANAFGETYSTEISKVTWIGLLPDGLSEQFNIQMKLPNEPQELKFEIVQKCLGGRTIEYSDRQFSQTRENMKESPVKFIVK